MCIKGLGDSALFQGFVLFIKTGYLFFSLYINTFCHYRSTKCELAKVMNRQTCYQELLQQKEDTIKHMAEHSGDSHSQITAEDNRKSRYMQMIIEVFPK